MSIRQPMFSPQGTTCPKCGTVQQSPGSTVCEHCGADLPRIGVARYAPPVKILSMGTRSIVRRLSGLAVWLLKRSITAALWPVLLALRILAVGLRIAAGALVLALLIVGLSYVPGVQGKVPVMKQVGPIAKHVLLQTENLGIRLWAVVWAKIPSSLHRPLPSASSQRLPSTRSVAAQPLTIESMPSGATVQLNARRVGTTPLTLRVAPGTYKVTFSRPGSVSLTRTITVTEGNAASLSVELVAGPATPSPVAPAQVPPSPTQDPTLAPPREKN